MEQKTDIVALKIALFQMIEVYKDHVRWTPFVPDRDRLLAKADEAKELVRSIPNEGFNEGKKA